MCGKGEKLECPTTTTEDHSQDRRAGFAGDVVRCSRPLRSVIEALSRIAFEYRERISTTSIDAYVRVRFGIIQTASPTRDGSFGIGPILYCS